LAVTARWIIASARRGLVAKVISYRPDEVVTDQVGG
jgi:hypothetical protein